RNFFDFLISLKEQGSLTAGAIAELRPQIHKYFEELSELYNVLLPLTAQIPQLLPQDREHLAAYLKTAPQKSAGLSFLLLFACNKLILDVSDFDEPQELQAERAEAKVRA